MMNIISSDFPNSPPRMYSQSGNKLSLIQYIDERYQNVCVPHRKKELNQQQQDSITSHFDLLTYASAHHLTSFCCDGQQQLFNRNRMSGNKLADNLHKNLEQSPTQQSPGQLLVPFSQQSPVQQIPNQQLFRHANPEEKNDLLCKLRYTWNSEDQGFKSQTNQEVISFRQASDKHDEDPMNELKYCLNLNIFEDPKCTVPYILQNNSINARIRFFFQQLLNLNRLSYFFIGENQDYIPNFEYFSKAENEFLRQRYLTQVIHFGVPKDEREQPFIGHQSNPLYKRGRGQMP